MTITEMFDQLQSHGKLDRKRLEIALSALRVIAATAPVEYSTLALAAMQDIVEAKL